MTRGLIAVGMLLAALLLSAGPAAAHLDLVGTTPSDGAALSEPVAQVSLVFSVAGEPAGEGIVLLDQAGQQIAAEVSTPDGGVTWIATPAAPLQSGQYGVTWQVAAPDTHPETGSFQFTVALPVAPEPAPAAEPAAPAPPPAVAEAPAAAAPIAEADTAALEEALAEPDTTAAQAVRWVGTAMMIAGALLGIGGLVFLALVMAGRRSEVRALVRLVRWSAALLIAGTVVQVLARSTIRQDGDWAAGIEPSALGDLLGSGSYGAAVGLRLLGGVLMLVGARAAFTAPPKAAMAATHGEPEDAIVAASLRRSVLAVIGAGMVLAAFLFDGHTATAEPRALVLVSDLVHVLAAATWIGGIVMLAAVLWRRKRSDHALDAAYLAVRFSVIAGGAVALAGVAGVALTVAILEEPSQLWTSTWGQVLLAKVALVGVVAAIGAYNHFRLVPVLEEAVDLRTDHPHLPADEGHSGTAESAGGVATATRERVEAAAAPVSRTLRATAVAEVLILLVVIGLTAWLVTASTAG